MNNVLYFVSDLSRLIVFSIFYSLEIQQFIFNPNNYSIWRGIRLQTSHSVPEQESRHFPESVLQAPTGFTDPEEGMAVLFDANRKWRKHVTSRIFSQILQSHVQTVVIRKCIF